jgi:carboxyl-terminal processing protease
VKCSYVKRRSATVWPTRLSVVKFLALGPFLLLLAAASSSGLGCASRWSGSVGAVLGKNNHDGRLYVREAPEDMQAAKAGIHLGDEVTAIDGKPVHDLTPDDVHKALAGAVGSKVKLTVVRDGQTISFEVERGPLRGQ